ncbi:hypothetical protein CCOS865_02701 [Pseudomonas reidholzensis]|uniref:Calcineurin-like phosphoesterase domain-containing protein n=1 Tax=Pseudomonas reidholzensis TaxID=1785162 RepID=A0A383RUV6_9PSED|nr:metallophosphoesterase [Pseudomonas reidholzensis]SYX90434.1 hypothetical protein CCOS865_02701 [Pseudomonas reidholzensis]
MSTFKFAWARRPLLTLLSSVMLTGALHQPAFAETNTVTQRFVFQSDTQYPRSPKGPNDPDGSARLLDAQKAAITRYRDAHGGTNAVPNILNGDITEFGHSGEWKEMKARMLPGTFYGLGNHDYENNVDDCAFNACATRSVVDYLTEDLKGWNVDAFDQFQEGSDSPTWQKYQGSMAYSKTFGDFVLIQLHNHYAYQKSWSGFHNFEDKTVHIKPSLDWLEGQLKAAEQARKLVIINMHRSPNYDADWGNPSEVARFSEMVNRYKVLAIFHGHTHTLADRGKIGDVPVLDSGSPINQTFLVGESDAQANAFIVKQAKNNVILAQPLLTIPLKMYIPEPDILAWPEVLDFTLPLRHIRDRDFTRFEVSLDGGAYVGSDANKKVRFNNLQPDRRYAYSIRVYDAGSRPVKTFTGTAVTAHKLLSPKDLCYSALGEPGAPNNQFSVKWSPPYAGYGPGNYWFRVALHNDRGEFLQELRGAAQGSRSEQITFREPAEFWNKRIHVRYQAAQLVDGADATFDLKDLFHGCGVRAHAAEAAPAVQSNTP